MREILFRAKRTDNGEWAEGDLRQDRDLKTDYISGWDYYATEGGLEREPFEYEVEPETLCQYTGKSDEDGKKIFEGDIVGFIDLYSTESGYSESSCLGEVVWSEEECCFHVTNRLSAESWEVLDECKVVGNVFDNPELIEEQ